jgi:PAS domain S-box-containing protein
MRNEMPDAVLALLIEDNDGDARLIRERLAERADARVDLQRVKHLRDGLARLSAHAYDVVLADLSLPDSQGFETFERVFEAAHDEPIVVLTGLDDEEIALRAMCRGAQDYLVKGRLNGELLIRSLRYAMERKQAERRLRVSEARFKAFMDNSPAIAWMKDGHGRYSYVNASWERYFDRSLDQLTGKTDLDLWSPGVAQHLRETDERVLVTRNPLQQVEMIPDSSGTLRTWLTYKFPLQSAGDGALIGGMSMDLTEQERAKEALRESEERYRRLVEMSPDAIFIARHDEIAFINEAGIRLFGARSTQQLLGKPLFEVIRFDDQNAVRRRVVDLMNRRSTFDFFEERIQRLDDGSRIDAEVAVTPLIDRGVPAIQVVLHDITERKRAEREIRARVEQQAAVAELGLYALKTRDLGELMDRAASVMADTLQVELCEVLELQPDERLLLRSGVGWKHGLVGHATVHAGRDSHAGHTLVAGKPVIVEDLHNEACFEAAMHREHGVTSGMSVVIAAQERPYGVLGAHSREQRRFTENDVHFLQAVANVLADAVARKRGEEQLERAFAQLRQMSLRIATAEQEERRRIARELHDELGQTLTCLKFEWASITRHIGEQQDQPSSPELELELQSAGALIDRTIQSARRLMTTLRPAILDDLGLYGALEAHGCDFQARTGIECDVYISPALKEMTFDAAVSTSIYRMVQELLTNVMRHANAGIVHVHLSEAGGDLRLRVADDGIGIRECDRAKPHSHGLRGIAERAALFAGSVAIEGGPGYGTSVSVNIPMPSA